MIDYAMVKAVHRTFVMISVAGFTTRGVASLIDAQWLRTRAARSVPHLIDTLLLISAVLLLWKRGGSTLHEAWLWAKMAGLLIYVGLGAIALGASASLPLRAAAFAAALLVVGWMASVAVTKDPLGLLRLLSLAKP